MKQIIFTLMLLLSLTTNTLVADIDADISAIKHASTKERFKLMNAFKRNLIKMKEEERIKAIKKLSQKSNTANAKKALDEMKQHIQTKHIENHLEYHHIDEDNIVNETTINEQGETND
jgi:intracellular sulfur oxidation DsrE/DsrF family protein